MPPPPRPPAGAPPDHVRCLLCGALRPAEAFTGAYPLEARLRGLPAALTARAAQIVDAALDRLVSRVMAAESGPGRGLALIDAPTLAAKKWDLIASSAYPDIRLLRGAFACLYGDPGGGKSTMMIKMLDGLPGPVVLLSAEEHSGPAVGERLKRCGVKRADFKVLGQSSVEGAAALCRRLKASALALDSVQATRLAGAMPKAEHLRSLLRDSGVGILLSTLQATKDGLAAGSNAILHEADLVIHVENVSGDPARYEGKWEIEKSRFAPTGLTGRV